MGFYSDVTIMAQPKAYEMIMDSIETYRKTSDKIAEKLGFYKHGY